MAHSPLSPVSASASEDAQPTPFLHLDFAPLDNDHAEFVQLVDKLSSAEKSEFVQIFSELCAHTEAHFQREEALMKLSRFPAEKEHLSDHRRVLGELHRFRVKVTAGRTMLARAYVSDSLPGWLKLHVDNMDAALVAHVKGQLPGELQQQLAKMGS